MTSYKTTCGSCGSAGLLHVVSGKFRAAQMKLSEDGFSFTAAKQIDTEEETVYCEGCHVEFPLADLTIDCPDCEGRGWLHAESSSRGREIQRCDSCRKLSGDDEAAAAHDRDCNCGWGRRTFKQLYVVNSEVTVAAPPDAEAEVRDIIDGLVSRTLPTQVADLPNQRGLMMIVGAQATDSNVADPHPSRRKLRELGVSGQDDSQ